MSRFESGDDYDVLAYGRWHANVQRAIKGRRGQKALREMRDALLAMPQRRLIADEFATPQGEVCAVGCAVAYKRAKATGVSIPEAAVELAKEDPDPFDQWTCHTRDLTCSGGPCAHRRCVNPAHLEPVSEGVNVRRGRGPSSTNAAKDRCGAGHNFDQANTYLTPDGRRQCRLCNRERTRRYRERRTGVWIERGRRQPPDRGRRERGGVTDLATMTERALSLRGKPAPEWDGTGLTIRLEYRLRWTGKGGVWAAVIEEPRKTASGRAGKPTHIITLVNDDSPHALLREVADLLDPDGPTITAPDA